MPRSRVGRAALTTMTSRGTPTSPIMIRKVSAKKMSQSENVRTRSFRSVEEREDYIRMMVCKCEGLYTFYKLWIAARILDVTKEEMKLLVKDRVPGG